MLLLCIGLAFGFLWAKAACAADYPTLSGRVVDEANILSPQAKQRLTQTLAAHEAATTNQVVVVTLRDLRGDTIDHYGHGLATAWKVGQKGKDNGVLLILALKERKVRVEVGYGLEGKLTDAASKAVLLSMRPYLQSKEWDKAFEVGSDAIIKTIK